MTDEDSPQSTILVVDDSIVNVMQLQKLLTELGYRVVTASNGEEALGKLWDDPRPDLVLTDIVMPVMDGYELCERIRGNTSTRLLPVIMATSSGEKIRAIESGADDFILKPYNQAELVARLRSLLRMKYYQDQVYELNHTLEERVHQQVEELQRMSQLRRFLSPHLADAVVNFGDDSLLQSHRSHIAVVFVDLRGFTSFSETAEPEELTAVLREYHQVLGEHVHRFDGTVGFFAGDGLMVFFNDPVPCEDPAYRALSMTLGMREDMAKLTARWRQRDYELGFGGGISVGYATLGQMGFEGRYDYTAVGPVVNQAARLSSEAKPGQILVSRRVVTDLEDQIEVEHVAEFELKGFHRPVDAYNVVSLKPRPEPEAAAS